MIQETITNQPVIETEKFDLRPLRASDKGLIELYGSDSRVAWNTQSIPHPLPPGMTDDLVARAMAPDRGEDVWALDASKLGGAELIGLISLVRIDTHQSEIGYWIAPSFWNSGLASMAVEALVDANPQNSRTLFAAVFQDNPASARVLTNKGFQYLGDAETFCIARGALVPTWTYSRKLD